MRKTRWREELGLLVGALEAIHEVHKRLDTRLGHGVVDGGTHAADGAVTLEVHEAGLRRLGNELGIEVLVARNEGNVHEGAALGVGYRGMEELGGIKVVVENLGLLGVPLVHGLKATVLE